MANSGVGMFLYAKLIMDHVTSLSNLQDIREEITILPEGLEEAFVPFVLALSLPMLIRLRLGILAF